MSTEHEVPIRDVRDNLAGVVDQAADGAITYVTRRGERVAAVVPVSMVRRPVDPPPDARRPAPSAAGGRFDDPPALDPVSVAEAAWTRAALEAMHLRVTTMLSTYTTWTRLTGQALAALTEGHHGTVQELVEAIEPFVQRANTDAYEAEELFYALLGPDDAYCQTCGAGLGMYHGAPGWQHVREVPNDVLGVGTKAELYTPADGHRPQVRRKPRLRPAIVDGTVERTG